MPEPRPRRFAIIGSRGYPSTYGGFETFVRRLAPYLVEHGDEVTVYCREDELGERRVDGVRCVATRGVDSNKWSTLSYGLSSTLHARRRRFDAALVLNVANGYFLPMLSHAKIPTAVNVDGIEWERGKWSRAGKAIFRRGAELTAKYANTIVVDSREIGRIWKDELGRDSTFLPYGADIVPNSGADRLHEFGLEPKTYALAVARMVPENNVSLFLDAVDRIGDQPAAVVGSSNSQDNPLIERLKQMTASRTNFRWLGHVSDQQLLSQLWTNCAVYYHGHSVGGTNPALLQALGHGAPTIALRTRYNCEVLGGDDQTFAPDAGEIATRIAKVTSDEGERLRMAQNGRDIINARYTWPAVLNGYRQLLHDLASRNRALARSVPGG